MISPHGHVDPRLLLDDEPFGDPASLFVTPDHYVTRLLHASGVRAGRPRRRAGHARRGGAREVWRALCSHWDVFRGTPVRFWLEAELAEIFGVTARPSAETADAIYDEVAERLAQDAYRPRALFERSGSACSPPPTTRATTSPPTRRSRRTRPGRARVDPDVPPRPLPGARAGRAGRRASRGSARPPDVDTSEYDGFVSALEARRRYFLAHGATSADHSHEDVRTEPLDAAEAARIYRAALAGEATAARLSRSGATCCSRWRGCRATTGSS